MKRIGILTLSASDNCGSLLQTYALQRILIEKFKCSVDIIDYRCEASDKVYSIFPPNPLKEKHRFLNALINHKIIYNQKIDYENYRKKYLNLTTHIYKNVKELSELDGKYDIIIVGSDQVWNVKMQDYDKAFFLGWVKKSQKVSYAASLGSHRIEESKDYLEIKEDLLTYKSISVREDFGANDIDYILGTNNTKIVLDPTLLLTQNDWQNVPGRRLIKEKYVFYYSWAYNNDNINKIVMRFSDKFNYKVYVINPSKWTKYKPSKYGFSLYSNSGPDAFLNLMKYSEYALVQSFHGIIFAYQMGKRFWLLDDHNENELDIRLKQVLSLLDMDKRVLRTFKNIDALELNKEESYFDTRLLEEKRRESLNYLKQILM